jgi:MFS family permease
MTTTTPVQDPPTLDKPSPETVYCANHPDVETLLRCNRCAKPICLKCAVLTDVGYRCKECIRGVQASYFNAVPVDNVIAFAVAAAVAMMAAPVAGLLLRITGFFGLILALMLGGGAGSALAQIVRAAVGRRRGRYLRFFALGGLVLGVLFGMIIGLFFGIPPFNLPLLFFAVLAAITAYQILR